MSALIPFEGRTSHVENVFKEGMKASCLLFAFFSDSFRLLHLSMYAAILLTVYVKMIHPSATTRREWRKTFSHYPILSRSSPPSLSFHTSSRRTSSG